MTHLLEVGAGEARHGKELGGVGARDTAVPICGRETKGINHRRSSDGPPSESSVFGGGVDGGETAHMGRRGRASRRRSSAAPWSSPQRRTAQSPSMDSPFAAAVAAADASSGGSRRGQTETSRDAAAAWLRLV